jgi:hypothetical protein
MLDEVGIGGRQELQMTRMEDRMAREVRETVRDSEVEQKTLREVKVPSVKAAHIWSSLDAPVWGCFSSFPGAGCVAWWMMRKRMWL